MKYIIDKLWTSKQRQGNSIHEISYRACFKPQLPKYFILKFTSEDDIIYDPFGGRGTTIIEAALLSRIGISNDINPLSKILISPRLSPPLLSDIETRLRKIPFAKSLKENIDLSMFYHPDTENEIISLKRYLNSPLAKRDNIDDWIRMAATSRLTGHSKGFFSVYTLPPNQSVSCQEQIRINKKRNQEPEYRDVKALIMKKSKSLLKDIDISTAKKLRQRRYLHHLYSEDARDVYPVVNNSVKLVITSPPFLDTVNYVKDNWLRCWFNEIDMCNVDGKITVLSSLYKWKEFIQDVFYDLYRVVSYGGHVAFEVGEIRMGKIKLEEHVIPLAIKAGFILESVYINQQNFTKTSNIWGVSNNKLGTNTNRIIIFLKDL